MIDLLQFQVKINYNTENDCVAMEGSGRVLGLLVFSFSYRPLQFLNWRRVVGVCFSDDDGFRLIESK